jgi:hypothetical protein
MKKKVAVTVLLVALMCTAMTAAVYAQTASVYVGYPGNPHDLGINASCYWIGQIPLTITSGTTSYSDEAFCLNEMGTIYEGSTYEAYLAPAPDTPQWESIAYLLSWFPATNNTEAAAEQTAIWKIIGTYDASQTEFTLPSDVSSNATYLVAVADGKEVIHPGDQLNWILPSKGTTTGTSAYPGQTVTFEVQLTNSTGARPGVQIDFNATLQLPTDQTQTLGPAYINSMQTFTDTDGIAEVTVTVPSYAPMGSTIQVQASTQSVWPQLYLNLTKYDNTLQDLIGTLPGDPFSLTVSANAYVLGSILVLPESAYGALTAIVAFAAAFIIYSKLKHSRN